MHRQLTTSKQLVKALAERAALWDHQQGQADEQVTLSPTALQQQAAAEVQPLSPDLQPSLNSVSSTGDSIQSGLGRTSSPAVAADHATDSLFAIAAAGPSARGARGAAGRPSSPRARRHQLLLLQQALFPLTRSQHHGEAGLRDDDLRPHANPKAKQVYDTLVGV
jgi:hypothetical protein